MAYFVELLQIIQVACCLCCCRRVVSSVSTANPRFRWLRLHQRQLCRRMSI